MATNSQFKVNQLAKDLNVKSKALTDILADKGIAVKTQSALEPAQFDVLFELLTREHQIQNIDAYMSGQTYIPARVVTPEPVKEQEAPKQEAPKQEAPKQEAPKQEAPKQEAPKQEAPKQEAPKQEAPKQEAPKQEAPKQSQPRTAPAAQQSTARDNAPARMGAGNWPRQGAPVGRPDMRQGAARQMPEQGRAPQRGDRPAAAQGGFTPRERTQGGFNANTSGAPRPDFRGGAQGQRPAGNDRFANPFGGPRQGGQQDRRPASNGAQGFRDKDREGTRVGGPKDTFKPQVIVRAQTQKGEVSNKQRGATRVVDMRAGSVDLSKYDEKLDTFVPDAVSDMRGGNQRVKKQGAQNGGMQKNRFGKNGKKPGAAKAPVTKAPVSVTLPEEIVVSDLASRLKVTSAEIVKRLMMLGMMVTVNQTVDYDTAAIVADEMGIAATKEVVVTIEEKLFEEETDDEASLVDRAPVVCVMGHVDHGKTSILDAIRHTNVTRGEAGGITQHIGAYRVKVNGQDITFLDTPGHEAFTAMRARGAQATDIAILVVAADDGIMPQTIEAINHAKAAGIDIIVAINKMDKPTANPDAIKQELTKYDLVPEEWGGDVICVPVSALTGAGIDDLLENVLLVAEVKELRANPNRHAKGIIIEAKLDKGRGPVATVLVQNGTLHIGDIVIAGTAVGRVRAMTDHNGRNLKEAGPSVPVEIIGLADVPSSGDEFNAVEDERMARTLADQRRAAAKEEVFKANARANLNDLFAQISEGVKELNIIVKADVGGSAEAVKQSLEKISNEEVKVRVIHAAAGGIREGDVMLASASNAIIVGFNVRPDKAAIDSAERQGVDIRTYRVIYDCINEITDAMKGMLAPKFRENLLGHAEVRQTIHVPNVGTIAGSYVQDGKVVRAAMIRVVRDGVVIFEDKIASLRRFKDDVKEVAQGYECGIGLDRFNDIKVGDVLEAYIMEEIER